MATWDTWQGDSWIDPETNQRFMFDPEQMRTRSVDEYNIERQQAAEGLAKNDAFYASNPQAFQKLTPEQTAYIKNFHGSADELTKYYASINPTTLNNLYGNGLSPNGADLWWTPQAGPKHTDNGGPLSTESILTGGVANLGSEQSQSDWNNMRTGLGIMALPFVGAGITAGVGAAGAGAGAAGAGAGGTEVGAGTLYAGETASGVGTGAGLGGTGGGATGMGVAEGGALSGSAGSASLAGGAGSDTGLSSMGETGAFDQGASQGVFDSAGNPIATSSDGGAFDMGGSQGVFDSQGNPTYSSPTTLASLTEQAKQMAAQLGISPASALGFLKNALTKGAPAVLGAIGANQQANSLSALAKQYMDLGAPSRARYEASFAPGFTMANDPGYQDALDASSKATLHGLSVQGNPAGSPNAWSQSLADNYAKTAYPALQNFRNTNANAGGIASLQTAAPAAATGAIGAQSNIFNAVGAGMNDIFNPQPSLAQTMAEYQRLIKQGSGAVQ